MMIGPDPRMSMVSRSSRRGTGLANAAVARSSGCYPSLLPDSFRIAMRSTVANPPQMNVMTTIMVIQVDAVMGGSSASRAAK
jgi:hypothetical protein